MVKHSTYPAPPSFPLEMNCSNEEQNSVPFIWISDNGVFSQLVTTFFPTACLHEIKGGIFSACSRLTEWNELHSHSHCSRHFLHIPHYGDKISMADGVFNIVIFFNLSWAVRGNAVKTASACLSVCQHCRPQCCSQDARQVLGEDKTAELKSLSEESKGFRHLLRSQGSSEELTTDQVGKIKVIRSPLKSVNFARYCQVLKARSVLCRVSHFATFWKHLLSFLLYLSLSTSIFPLWFSRIKELKVIFLLCLIMTVQPPQMVIKLSYRSEKFYYICRVFSFYMPAARILYVYS